MDDSILEFLMKVDRLSKKLEELKGEKDYRWVAKQILKGELDEKVS